MKAPYSGTKYIVQYVHLPFSMLTFGSALKAKRICEFRSSMFPS